MQIFNLVFRYSNCSALLQKNEFFVFFKKLVFFKFSFQSINLYIILIDIKDFLLKVLTFYLIIDGVNLPKVTLVKF